MFNPISKFPDHFINPNSFTNREMFEEYRNMLSTVVYFNRASLSDYGFMIEKSLNYRLIEDTRSSVENPDLVRDSANSCYVIFPDLEPGSYSAKINLVFSESRLLTEDSELPVVGYRDSVFKVTLTGKLYDLTSVNLDDKRRVSSILNKNLLNALLSATSYLRCGAEITEDSINPETGRFTLVLEYSSN